MVERNLSKIECGQTFVTSENLSKIISALDITPADLFNFEHNKEKDELKEELINAIKEEKIDVNILYRMYKSLK